MAQKTPPSEGKQLDLRQSGPERTLEVECSNCGAKFVAYYGFDEENTEKLEVRSSGLCRGDTFKRDRLKGVRFGWWPRSNN